MKNWLALIVAVVLGLVAVYGMRQYIGKKEEKLKVNYEVVRIVVAGQELPAGTTINKLQMLESAELPKTALTDDHILTRDADRLLGQTIVRTVQRGEPLLISYFRQPVDKLEARLRPGERAITLRVDGITGVAGNVGPGSHVDILGTFPSAQAKGQTGTSGAAANHTVPVLCNVTILAIDSRLREEDYTAVTGVARGRSYSSVTVAVTPSEAMMLIYAQQLGNLTLALRPPADSSNPPFLSNDITDKTLLDLIPQLQKARDEALRTRQPMEVAPAETRP